MAGSGKQPGDQAWSIGFDEGWYWATIGTDQESSPDSGTDWAARDYPDQWQQGYDAGDKAGREAVGNGWTSPEPGLVAQGEDAGKPATVASKSWIDGLIAIADAAGKVIGYGLPNENAPAMSAQAKAGSFNVAKPTSGNAMMIAAALAAGAFAVYALTRKK